MRLGYFLLIMMINWEVRSDCPICLGPGARVSEKENNDKWRTCIVCLHSWPGDAETAVKYGL